MLKTYAFLLATACAAGVIAEDQPKNLTFATTLKSVAVFRDGFGYYVREGKCKLENGWATTNFVPAAIRGTVWVYSLDKDDRIDTVITTKDNRIGSDHPRVGGIAARRRHPRRTEIRRRAVEDPRRHAVASSWRGLLRRALRSD